MENRFAAVMEMLQNMVSEAKGEKKAGMDHLCFGEDAADVADMVADHLQLIVDEFRAFSRESSAANEAAVATAADNVPHKPGYYVIEAPWTARPYMVVERVDGVVRYTGVRYAERAYAEEYAEIYTEDIYGE